MWPKVMWYTWSPSLFSWSTVTSIEAEEALASLIFGQVLGKKQAYYW